MNESQEKKEFKHQIENLKKMCFEYEKGLNNEQNIKEERIQLENEILNLQKENNERKKEIQQLKNNYQNLLNFSNSNYENEKLNKEKELEDLKTISNKLNKELKETQDACDLLKDENYLLKFLGYWTPQAMFKYIQAYDNQN
jgi:hypothetical protein